jgi:hypothetical protein
MPDRMLHPGQDVDFVTYDSTADLKDCVDKCAAGSICIAGRGKDTGVCMVATYTTAANATAQQQSAVQATVHVKVGGADSRSYVAFLSGRTWEKSAAANVSDMPASAGDAAGGLPACKAACTASADCVAVVFKRAAGVCTFKKASVDNSWVEFEAAVVMG